jgi:NDP-sugar pyrophosphorylase family protein
MTSINGEKMKVVMVAAGLGKRLRPYTDSIPKCMVPIAGKDYLKFLAILDGNI